MSDLKKCPKTLWLECLCAWNNVPFDCEALKKYTDENWGKLSVDGWKRVANVLNTRHSAVTPEEAREALKEIKKGWDENGEAFLSDECDTDVTHYETIRRALKGCL